MYELYPCLSQTISKNTVLEALLGLSIRKELIEENYKQEARSEVPSCRQLV